MREEELLYNAAKEIGINLNECHIEKFLLYKYILLEWNNKINLTAIKENREIIIKHFIDSLTCVRYIRPGMEVIDIGTGAGFPGIPLKIFFGDQLKLTLVDSIAKKIVFLNEVIKKLELTNTDTIHARAEELGKNPCHREKYDIALARAVANLRILVEYCLPFVKICGYMIAMKGNNLDEELNLSKNAVKILGGEIEKVEMVKLPYLDIVHSIVEIKKIRHTPLEYPRRSLKISKKPLP